MVRKFGNLTGALLLGAALLHGGTFGRVIPIGGQAADLALDEPRGQLYVANFTANRIDVISLATNAVRTSISVPAQPSGVALSPDGRWLMVTHYGNFAAPGSPANGITVIDLTSNARQSYALGAAPLGVGFGFDGLALVVTATEFLLVDPGRGTAQSLDTIAGVTAKTLPQPAASLPGTIIAASVAVSRDGAQIFGITDTIRFRYDVRAKLVLSLGYTATPPMGPRVATTNADGSFWNGGWGQFDRDGLLLNQFGNAKGVLGIGSLALDSTRGLIYSQVVEDGEAVGPGDVPRTPVLKVSAADNLALLEKISLPENLAGKSVMRSDDSVMYAISVSGVTVLPVGELSRAPKVVASRPDLVFRGNFCDRRVITQELQITSPGGGNVPFTLSTDTRGITIVPANGVTPATVRITVDPASFASSKGTTTALLNLRSGTAVNLPEPVRLLINNREPDQRGTFVNVPGKLVDVLADPVRDRFYILRQSTNEVLVYNAANYTQVTAFRTPNTPTQMAITFDQRHLLVGSDNSQMLAVYDLETLRQLQSVRMPRGHYPRSVAASANAILVANRVAGTVHVIDRVDLANRVATELPSLGVFENNVNINTVLVASPNGSSILAAAADGNTYLYNANVDTFTVSRRETERLEGAYAAGNFDNFFVGNSLLNASLVAIRQNVSSTGSTSGFAFVNDTGYVASASGSASPGVLARVDASGAEIRPTRFVEAPSVGTTGFVFTRTLAPLASRRGFVTLTQSGFTVLPWDYDASVAPPRIDRVTNAADFRVAVAPGGLISVFGTQLSPVNLASNELPIPTALGDSCLTVNGLPIPILFVSPNQVNAQLPFQAVGNVQLILRTPGGVSDTFNLTILPAAPSVFRAEDNPVIVRTKNEFLVTPSNPVHKRDILVIYLTGLGATAPLVEPGAPAPASPLAQAVTPPTVTLGGVPLQVQFAGLSPGSVGLYQINVSVPSNVPLGLQVPLTINQGTSSTTVTVRVVD
jgi:uncharacterized protein (TIGR03437 family)